MRNFVTEYEQGSRQASQLVSNEALRVREVVVRQSGETEKALREHVTQTSAKFERKMDHEIEKVSRERLRERLLKSLKYPGMNERANQVEIAYEQTFRWLFADADADDSSYSGGGESCRSCSEELDDQDEHSEDDWTDVDTDDEPEEEPPDMVWSSFTDWLQSDLSMYWIMGKPGSGKSTLSKFILSEPRFKIALARWRCDVFIACHFFWRPGALLQRSIKGMLCAIIYQLVPSIPDSVEFASSNVAGLGQKDCDTDWSVPELERLCLGLIKHCGTPLCLFIDGLDECGPEDDHQKLLDTLDRIRLPNVKIITSSRNEPVFEQRFRHEPQLRVQDLTAGDLHIYATGMLSRDIQDEFLEELVQKSEGVFLWMVLAVQSINRGFSNGDSLTELRRRIGSLPMGLNDLYKNMWERLNHDTDLYRESAALYFKLAVAGQDRVSSRSGGWTPLEMMLASFATSHIAFARPTPISASQLLKECKKFHKRVEVRCAGLLGLCGKPNYHPLKEDLGDAERVLLEYADTGSTFQFIHRSARDFLVDTVEGQNILRHDKTSLEDINIRCISASLRALELLDPILGDKAQSWYWFALNLQDLINYLEDLSSIGNASDSAVRELVARCYELCCSSILILDLEDERPERRAAFFKTAALYPNLNRHLTSIIQNQLVGTDIRSAVLLSVGTACHGHKTIKLVRWLLSLPDVDVNLKCPLVVPRSFGAWCSPDNIGPLDHIKESPLSRLLGSGLERMDWRFPERPRHRYQFLGLVSDFALQGTDFHSTLFLVIPLDYPSEACTWAELHRQPGPRRFFQFAGRALFKWGTRHDGTHDYGQTHDGILCVVALQAKTVIQRMLASLPMTNTGRNILGEDGYSPSEDEYSPSDLEAARQILSQRCQEYGCEANDRVVGLLQPCGNLRDMPYRRVNDRDSAKIVELVLKDIFEENSRRHHVEAACREAITRSPFSSIGFRDYLRNMGSFDAVAALNLLLEYKNGTVKLLSACTLKCWQQLMTCRRRTHVNMKLLGGCKCRNQRDSCWAYTANWSYNGS